MREFSQPHVVEQDPGNAQGIWYPDVAGCRSAADEFEDLFPDACTAHELHLEHMEAYLHRPAEEILKRPECRLITS